MKSHSYRNAYDFSSFFQFSSHVRLKRLKGLKKLNSLKKFKRLKKLKRLRRLILLKKLKSLIRFKRLRRLRRPKSPMKMKVYEITNSLQKGFELIVKGLVLVYVQSLSILGVALVWPIMRRKHITCVCWRET